MTSTAIKQLTTIDRSQWKPEEYDLCLHLDYGRCVAGGMGDRVLGIVTQTLDIEREGKRVLTLDLGAPVSASLQPSYDADGYIRTARTFPLPSIYFGRTGYRVRIEV